MRKHGVRFQPSLAGTLHLSRTNAFFMGGGKALVNAYYRSAARLGVQILYDTPVDRVDVRGGRFMAARVGKRRFAAASCVVASGGFESNPEWLRAAWGQADDGHWIADNFLIRGTRFNRGTMLANLVERGADAIGDPTQAHMVAVDARAPLYDGGICTRIDAVSLGIVVNREARRFHDEGEDFWPKRYAIWGRLVAQQPGQIGYAIIDSKAIGLFMPPVFRGERAGTVEALARLLGLDASVCAETVRQYNAACRPGRFDHTVLDDCATEGLTPPKTHWARAIDAPPFFGYPLRPGITFTYYGLKVDEHARVHFGGVPGANLFAAGEIMAGNVLGKGYTAGVGMSIGTAFGRIAGAGAAALRNAASRVGSTA